MMKNLLDRKNAASLKLRTLEQEALDLHAKTADPKHASLALIRLRRLVPKINLARACLENAQIDLHRGSMGKEYKNGLFE